MSQDLLQQLDTIFGLHPGFRPAHAKGIMLMGKFTPFAGRSFPLTRAAPHINRESTPVTVRFSRSSTGVPLVPDNEPNANPRGLAIRFHLADRVHTDIVSYLTDADFLPAQDQSFWSFCSALASIDPSKPSPSPIEAFLGAHPEALAFVQAFKPDAVSAFAQ